MKGGLGKWFGERWVDVKTGKPCGRSGSEKYVRAYPACRPAEAAAKMSQGQKAAMSKKKTGPARKSWPISPSGRKKQMEAKPSKTPSRLGRP